MPVYLLLQNFLLCMKSWCLLPSLILPLALPAFPEEYDIILWQHHCRLSCDMIHIHVSVTLLRKWDSFLCPDTCYNSLQYFPAAGLDTLCNRTILLLLYSKLLNDVPKNSSKEPDGPVRLYICNNFRHGDTSFSKEFIPLCPYSFYLFLIIQVSSMNLLLLLHNISQVYPYLYKFLQLNLYIIHTFLYKISHLF